MGPAAGEARGKLTEAVEALYFRVPTAAELEGTGFKPKHYVPPDVTVWPENQAAIALFQRISNQWRCGPGGPIGLDYAVVFNELSHIGVAGAERDDLMAALAVIEVAAIKQINES